MALSQVLKRGEAARFPPLPKRGEGSETFAARIIDEFSVTSHSTNQIFQSGVAPPHSQMV